MFYAVVRFLVRPLVYLLFRPKVIGKANLPKRGPAILAANHLGVGETFLIPVLMPPQITFPAKQELFQGRSPGQRLLSWFLRKAHQVPIDRAGGGEASVALGSVYDVLEQGGFVAVFPEGHRSPDGRLYKGHTGVARLALTSGAPVIPVGCFRTRFVKGILPWPWLYRPQLCIGEPMAVDPIMRQNFLEATQHRESAEILRAFTAEVMDRIAAITGQAVVDRYSTAVKSH
ncbi:MAG: 1-acyl-sn-glycerol-3-phosphate acyltransferase [Propionibacteriaceae bacterium]|nr:1-acyl-sn-glycerol-3-phosphate acyltransferase [Propionibacteriaceae bacterium]